jgi:hypothetical protein
MVRKVSGPFFVLTIFLFYKNAIEEIPLRSPNFQEPYKYPFHTTNRKIAQATSNSCTCFANLLCTSKGTAT